MTIQIHGKTYSVQDNDVQLVRVLLHLRASICVSQQLTCNGGQAVHGPEEGHACVQVFEDLFGRVRGNRSEAFPITNDDVQRLCASVCHYTLYQLASVGVATEAHQQGGDF